MSIRVRLTYAQCSIGAHVASMRRGSNRKQRRVQRHGLRRWTWSMEVEGCCAEIAVAEYLNLYWDGGHLDRRDERDVGGLIEVRHTEREHDGRLIVHRDDEDDAPFVLVTGRDGLFELIGWMSGCDAKRDCWWCDPTGEDRPAFFVPRELPPLREMAELRDWVEQRRPSLVDRGELVT